MKHAFPIKKILLMILTAASLPLPAAHRQQEHEALSVIQRFAGKDIPVKLSLSLKKLDGRDQFETSVKDGTLTVKGSSGIALCRGFYHYLKTQKAGICSWSGNRVQLPARLTDEPASRVESPFRHHYYLNVVTYGYTMPYWDWTRWEKEIDWMALHGIDMPLALVANEAITARVWKKLGLTDKEIGEYFTGPAHLPWMRMGNLSSVDGPLPDSWHREQIELQHRILNRMRALGMQPICPAFAGFVPKAITRLYPNAQLTETTWAGHFHNWMLSADSPLFHRIGKMFIEEWEKEFGPCPFYLADSFNEMSIPFPPHGDPARYSQMARFGAGVYNAIHEASPRSTWVMQGWMLGYSRDIWDYRTLDALLSDVPDNRVMILDLAADYNRCFWKSQPNWDFYKGFMNKQWTFSVIPNMGGKTAPTGMLEFYANGRLEALRSPNRGQLTGYGMAPEGIENNEVIYELVCDGGWTDQEIDLDDWLDNYTRCRYGASHPAMRNYWNNMLQSVYGSFTDHPRYNWQFRPGRVKHGSVHTDSHFYQAIENFAQAADTLGTSALYLADLTELTAHYLGGKLELLAEAFDAACLLGDTLRADTLQQRFERMMANTDRVLASHPLHRLERWLAFARMHGDSPAEADRYEANARRIVTIWGPPVDDYSARVWSGLIRDYYLPRWHRYFQARRSGQSLDLAAWERQWVEHGRGTTPVTPLQNPVQDCRRLLAEAASVQPLPLDSLAGNEAGSWSPQQVSTEWKELTWHVPREQLSGIKGVLFRYIRGYHKLMIREVRLEMDGKTVARDAHEGETGLADQNNFYRLAVPAGAGGNNTCTLHAVVKTEGGTDSYGHILLIGGQ